MSNYYDPQDISNRQAEARKARPKFYYKAVYNEQKVAYDVLLFMSLHNGESGQSSLDFMETLVRQKHISYYNQAHEDFVSKNYLHRNEFTFDEMLKLPAFAQKVEDLEYKISLPKTNPAYWSIIKDFSLKLNHSDVKTLNKIAGYEPDEEPQEATAPVNPLISDDVAVKIIELLQKMDARITALEQPLN